MTSYGKNETEQLKQNLEKQLDRLMEQLTDLENCKEDYDKTEYEEIKSDTTAQLEELKDSLNKLIKGDISLSSVMDDHHLETQGEASHNSDAKRLFIQLEPAQLRTRLDAILHSTKLSDDEKIQKKAKILLALRAIGDQLSINDLQFLEQHNESSNAFTSGEFVRLNNE